MDAGHQSIRPQILQIEHPGFAAAGREHPPPDPSPIAPHQVTADFKPHSTGNRLRCSRNELAAFERRQSAIGCGMATGRSRSLRGRPRAGRPAARRHTGWGSSSANREMVGCDVDQRLMMPAGAEPARRRAGISPRLLTIGVRDKSWEPGTCCTSQPDPQVGFSQMIGENTGTNAKATSTAGEQRCPVTKRCVVARTRPSSRHGPDGGCHYRQSSLESSQLLRMATRGVDKHSRTPGSRNSNYAFNSGMITGMPAVHPIF